MDSIRPLDTTATVGYVTTLALAYIPSDLVNPLSLQLHNPNSRLYQQPDPAIKTLMSMLDPTIPLVANQGSVGSSGNNNAVDTGDDSGDDGNNSGGADAGASNSSSPVRASSVGIGVGVVCGAAAYGAAMFYVARRYRKKRQLHQRSSSVSDMTEAAGAGSIFTGGHLSPFGNGRNSQNSGRSARTQMISAPVMAENSLGWN